MLNAQICVLSLSHAVLGQLSVSAHQSSAKTHCCYHQWHAGGACYRAGCVDGVCRTLGVPVGQLRGLLAKCPQWLMGRLSDGFSDKVSKIHIPLIHSESLAYCSPSHSLPPVI